MGERALDDVDRRILHVLQEDCRNTSTEEIGTRVGVSASTVRNRIAKMESQGVIVGYQPVIDYERAGYSLHLLLVCTVSAQSEEIYERLLDLRGVVSVRQTLTTKRNLHVEIVGENASEIVQTTNAVTNLGVSVENTELLRRDLKNPFDHFTAETQGREEN